ncbi:CBN-TWK-44 protein [Caenorhabditis brenneri]|uniref:CBN-TWK-44 protein n=1 Tax=Caenorhabditis brenneri TaxID=135651 RepID=G0M6V3_CAEBE|nr:CBN-TWK-44 protein [Caenorhabditis brenneri]
MLPFSRKRERQHLIAELQKKLQRKEKSTQTDFGYPHCEEAYTETSDVDSCVTDFRNSVISDKSHHHLLLIPDGPICGPSRCESRPVVALAEASLCSSSSVNPSSYPSSHRPSSTIPSSSPGSRVSAPSAASSAKSAPAASPNRQPPLVDFDPSRRWTFVATNRNQRGYPRGLVVPYMYTRPMVRIFLYQKSIQSGYVFQSSVVHTTEVRRLIAELDVRLQDCRSLATPTNSIRGTVSERSFSRSVISDSSIPEEL